MDFRRVVSPINRLIHVAKNKLFKCLVGGSQLNEFAETIPTVREQLSDRIADTFANAAVVAL
jgi:hypothetical protein